jgi:hypothetical protein
MTTDQWIGAIAAAAAIGVLIVSMIAVVASLMGVRDQLRTSVFIAYTERYSKIMSLLPFDVRRPGSDYSLDDVPQAERTMVLSGQDRVSRPTRCPTVLAEESRIRDIPGRSEASSGICDPNCDPWPRVSWRGLTAVLTA